MSATARLVPSNSSSFHQYNNRYLPFVLQIDLKHINQKNDKDNKVEIGIDLREFYPSVEWDILGVPAERHEKYYPCCAEPYPGEFMILYFFPLYIVDVMMDEITLTPSTNHICN